ncbi:glycosyltransferase family 9 protein [Desulfovibrio sp. JC022]|uniref:glycosyltransferase family 9 protein n=1 Tax=Desulfovibrio sp. JC022 TaxID=2593642 RepID=UPI0013D1AAF0|nr:glycosyltransferase family 9 protein [Desulfovibrio sp. JC022]NDV22738.1 glycosyltransferase family 9 protein [Desulfovibrio sp. JC022]
MKALVINLTRFGDLLQTQPVITALAEQGYEVGVMCLKNFAGTTQLLRNVAKTFPLPGSSLLAAIDRDWRDAVNLFESYCAEIEDSFDPALVINLTPSVSSRLIALRLSKGREVRGFAMDEFGFNADTSRWAGFLQMASSNRGSSPFNVVDLFSKVAGIDNPAPFELAEPSPEMKVAALKLLENPAPGAKGFVGFQPGASEDRRRWPVDHFRELGRRLWKEKRRVPVLLGAESERGLGERILERAEFPSVNLMGGTSLPELAAVLRRLDLLVTNDTGTMHLAAGVGTPLAAIFLATAQPWDTGPAAENLCCFEPDLDCHPCPFGQKCVYDNICRQEVAPDAVFEAASSFIDSGKWGRIENREVRAYLTGRDGLGFISLSSLSGHEQSDRHKWILLQRELYRRFLDGEDIAAADLPRIELSSDLRSRLLSTLNSSRDVLFLLSKQAMILKADPIEAIKIKFLANLQKIQDILSSCPELSVLSSMWMIESRAHENMDGVMEQLSRYMDLIGGMSVSVE